jgi:hypothetical protein
MLNFHKIAENRIKEAIERGDLDDIKGKVGRSAESQIVFPYIPDTAQWHQLVLRFKKTFTLSLRGAKRRSNLNKAHKLRHEIASLTLAMTTF